MDCYRRQLLVGAFLALALATGACSVETRAAPPVAAAPASAADEVPDSDVTSLDVASGADGGAGSDGLGPPEELGFVALGDSGLQASTTGNGASGRGGPGPASGRTSAPAEESDPPPMTDEDKAQRGALVIEAFGLPGGRLISDEVRTCVHDEFVATSGALRLDQLVAGMTVATSDVGPTVEAIHTCGGLSELAELLTVELAQGLDALFDPAIASCIAEFYSQREALMDLLVVSIDESSTVATASGATTDRAATRGALDQCLGLGDVLAADSSLIDTTERDCLNSQGSEVMRELLNVEVRSAAVSLDAEMVREALIACLPEEDRGVLGD